MYNDFMRTTLDIPDSLFKKVKTRAVEQGVTMKDLLAHYIEAGLNHASLSVTQEASQKKNPYPFPIIWKHHPGDPITPQRTNAELFAILEKEEIEQMQGLTSSTQTD
jgi:hypothetical protein